jgi:hypothetical protein
VVVGGGDGGGGGGRPTGQGGAGCLALGHLQARQAVPKLLHLWYYEGKG